MKDEREQTDQRTIPDTLSMPETGAEEIRPEDLADQKEIPEEEPVTREKDSADAPESTDTAPDSDADTESDREDAPENPGETQPEEEMPPEPEAEETLSAAEEEETDPAAEEPENEETPVPDLSAGEEETPKPHRRWFHYLGKAAKIAVIAAAVLVVAVIGFFLYEYNRLQKEDLSVYTDENVIENAEYQATTETEILDAQNMEEQLADVEETEAIKAEGEIFQDDSVYNILLIGTDDRTEEFSANARGDTCMLLSLNKNTGRVSLISFERGMGVPVLWGPYEGQWDWLTHTFAYGGADMMVQEIRDNFKVDVDRHIRINIRTLIKLIDAIGGVDIEVTQAEADMMNNPNSKFTKDYAKGVGKEDELQTVTVGVNHMNGTTAMVYARLRELDDDWHRVVRQRNVITAAADRLSELSATGLISMLDQIVPLVETDLSETEVANLLTLAPQFIGAEIDQMTVPVAGTYGSMRGLGGKSMFAVDFDTNAELIRQQLYGELVSSEEDSEEESAYGNPYNADSHTYNSVSSGSSGSGSSGYVHTGSGADNTISDQVTNNPTDTTATDGTVVSTGGAAAISSTTNADGSTTTNFADGTTSTTNADGSKTTTNPDGSTTLTFPDGTTTIVTTDGTTITTMTDGTTTAVAADGTVVQTTPDGTTTATSADGTTVTTTAPADTGADPAGQDAAAAAGPDTTGMDPETAAQVQAQYQEQLAAQQAAAAEAAAQQAAAEAAGQP